MQRIDHYLTRKARAAFPGAKVLVLYDGDEETEAGRVFVLDLPGEGRTVLAGKITPPRQRFGAAREALYQLIDGARA